MGLKGNAADLGHLDGHLGRDDGDDWVVLLLAVLVFLRGKCMPVCFLRHTWVAAASSLVDPFEGFGDVTLAAGPFPGGGKTPRDR